MHDGSLASLEDVVDYYSRGANRNPYLNREIHVLNLSDQEKRALVAFLHTLTGEVHEGM